MTGGQGPALGGTQGTDGSPRPPEWRVRLHWEDFQVGEVREFGHHVVTRDAVLEFAARFDPQPFHLDDDAAAKSLFGRLAASGWHTCAIAMRLLCDGYLLDSASLGSPGIEKLAWPHPVFPGDTLRLRATVLATRPLSSRPNVGLVHSRSQVLNQNDQTVLTMDGAAFFARRTPATPAGTKA